MAKNYLIRLKSWGNSCRQNLDHYRHSCSKHF